MDSMQTTNKYMSGFGNYFASEAEAGALPKEQNSPQKNKYGLYTEQLSGSPFMAARNENRHTWLYKTRPSVGDYTFKVKEQATLIGRPFGNIAGPVPLRWQPLEIPKAKTDFVDGLFTIAGNGNADSVRGSAVHVYRANVSMHNRFFADNDAELLFVPEAGSFKIFSELGEIDLRPGEIGIIPRSMKFKIELVDKEIRGYLLENFGPYLRLPELGPIGANGLAYPDHFLCPQAKYESSKGDFELIVKFQDRLWTTSIGHSPLDVVAWKGNYVPYKYDLSLFQVINSVSFDHCDPSVYTLLSSPSELPGIANVDFAIFPPRWSVAEHTFRLPYFHRNCMNELMGMIFGEYEVRGEDFLAGGISLHNSFVPHGPDPSSYEKAINAELKPQKLNTGLAIMFESSLIYQPTKQALNIDNLDRKYTSVWQGYN